MSTHRYALVKNNEVKQVAFFENDHIDLTWLTAIEEQFDLVQEVTDHPYPVNVGDSHSDAEGFRPPSPFPSWSWNETAWEAPVPKPQGPNWYWYEETGEWVYVGPPLSEQPTIATL
jgi:hypothetical protein